MTPRDISYQLYIAIALIITFDFVSEMSGWANIDRTLTSVWICIFYATSRVCDALQLVWEKLPKK